MGYGTALAKTRLSSVDTFSNLRNIGLSKHPTTLDQTQKKELERLGKGLPTTPDERGLASITAYSAAKQHQAKIAQAMVGQAKAAMAAQVELHRANQQHLSNAMESGKKMAEIDNQHAQNTALYASHVTQQIAEARGVVAAYRANSGMMNF